MERIAISKLRANLGAVLDRVKNTKEPILVTRRGIPIALVEPVRDPEIKREWFGCMKGSGEIKGDLVAPLGEDAREVLRSPDST